MPELPQEPRTHGPTYWFVVLDSALEDGDWEAAARAAEKLCRLGIDVRVNLGRLRVQQPEASGV
jgi:hypothetical protein